MCGSNDIVKYGDVKEFFDFAEEALNNIAPILNAIEKMYID
jgi:hypothetical protein